MKKGSICTKLLYTAFLIAGISSCKKEGSPKEDDQYIDGYTNIYGIRGTDTSSTKYIRGNGRTETVALAIDQDTQLKAELTNFTPLPGGQGQYTIKVTNLTSCQMILRWNWNELALTSIEPTDATTGTLQSDIIGANSVKTYIAKGKATIGTIFVKAEKHNTSCPNSKQLKLDVTSVILPIEYTGFSRTRIGEFVTVQWNTETPGDVDKFLVMWTPTGKKEDEVLKYTVPSDPNTKKYIATYPAVKKIK